jgi:hypothetical protein
MIKRKLSIFLVVAILFPVTVTAQQLHETYKDWRVLTVTEDGQKFCYIASVPIKKAGNYNRRDEPFLLVTHRRADLDEVSVSSGYPYKKGSDVKVSIDGRNFTMFTKGERAWALNEAQDNQMVASMIRGNKMTVHGTSQLDTYSKDTYSLGGFTSAHTLMKKLCR